MNGFCACRGGSDDGIHLRVNGCDFFLRLACPVRCSKKPFTGTRGGDEVNTRKRGQRPRTVSKLSLLGYECCVLVRSLLRSEGRGKRNNRCVYRLRELEAI